MHSAPVPEELVPIRRAGVRGDSAPSWADLARARGLMARPERDDPSADGYLRVAFPVVLRIESHSSRLRSSPAAAHDAWQPAPEPVSRHLVYQKVTGETGIWIADVDGSNARSWWGRPRFSPTEVVACHRRLRSTGHARAPTSYSHPRQAAPPSHEARSSTGRLTPERVVALQTLGRRMGARLDAHEHRRRKREGGDACPWRCLRREFLAGRQADRLAVAKKPSHNGFIDEKIDLFVTGRDGGEAKQITDDGQSGWPVWGPKSIAFGR